ncbi:glycosyltransferase family 2 protein [Labrys monachus]|uniref:Glycosyltransferase involved in cell wall biosynthesis n=1 Tax=Labrys monachus TaxID=217067 RepID=A0ABU0FCL5_9HYPH|nr:glycosyltransferase family 2 protein [Labrys monachus]MDQ0392176.1 glycosyltransferase involved in cell wall biosynthesis [Labrys monachus]
MTTVTVGVPVYNGADQLRECIECLLAQTLRDIEIRIYDNASADATPDIARAFEARDSRVRHIRHPENIRAMPNFHRIILDCTTPHMMWRAHDDLCSPDYIERLNNALIADPAARLAVPTTNTLSSNGRSRYSRPRPLEHKSATRDILQLLFNSHAGWFYGLWNRDALLREFERAWTAFPHAWALDHLILFPFLLDRSVAIVPEAVFIQRLVTKSYTPKKGTKPPVSEMLALRRQFAAQCRRYIDERPFSTVERLTIRAALPFYVDKRVYRLSKIIKRTVLRDKSPAGLGSEF